MQLVYLVEREHPLVVGARSGAMRGLVPARWPRRLLRDQWWVDRCIPARHCGKRRGRNVTDGQTIVHTRYRTHSVGD